MKNILHFVRNILLIYLMDSASAFEADTVLPMIPRTIITLSSKVQRNNPLSPLVLLDPTYSSYVQLNGHKIKVYTCNEYFAISLSPTGSTSPIILEMERGIVHTKCGRVDIPFIIECNPGEMIYIRKTVMTEFINSEGRCLQLDYNLYCHVFVNHTDIEFNGKQVAGFTFWKELLRNYDHLFGNCRQTSTSETIQINYQCLKVTSIHNICDSLEIKIQGEGHIVSPKFPLAVDKQHESCSCEVSTVYPAHVKLTAIIINPTATSMWSLRLTADDRGWSHDIAKNVMYTTHLNHLSGQSVTLDYFSRRDTTYEPVYLTGKPAGFWMKVESTYGNSVLSIRCFSLISSKSRVKGTLSSGAVLGIISCIIAVFFIFLIFVAYFVYFWRKKWYCKPNPTSLASNDTLSGHTNMAISIEESVHPKTPKVCNKSKTLERFLKEDSDYEFNKTTNGGKMRYSTLPCRKKHPFDITQRFMSCRIKKTDVHKLDVPLMCTSGSIFSVSIETSNSKDKKVMEKDSESYISFDLSDFDEPQLCSSRNISVVSPKICTPHGIIAQEREQTPEDNNTFGMFDFDVLYLAGATDVEIDV